MIINKAWNLFQLISGSIKKGNACINKIYIESLNYVSNKMFIEPKNCVLISVSKRIHFSSNTAFFSSSSSSFSPFLFLPLFLFLLDRVSGLQFRFQTRQHSGFARDGTTLTEKTKAPALWLKMSPQTWKAVWTAGRQGTHVASPGKQMIEYS